MSSPARLGAFLLVTSSLAVAFACGGSGDPSEFASSSSTSGASGSSGDNTSGGTSGFGTSGASGGTSGTSGQDSGPCIAPVEMYIVFDKSGSMGEPFGNGAPGDCNIGDTKNSKWCKAINALSGYLKSPSAKDQAAALQFFSGNDNPSCGSGDPYDKAATPATGYTILPSTAFDSALNATVPGGATPMEAAIRGLTKFTAANRTPGKVTIGILITDGDPQGCNTNIGQLAQLIDQHYQATKIRTYVIGMNGATFSNLEQLAGGGGAPPHAATVGALTNACGNVTAPCKFWNVGDGDPAGFIQALAAIQEASDGCKPGGGTVNPPK
ncbi:MAG: VWA domain-containing protein [Deltaproteobacteria bacterium]|nr:VWA domain-containing protein [Deltaproteobacteria bacterium]